MTDVTPPPLRWWGWGARAVEIPEGLAAVLTAELAVEMSATAAALPEIDAVKLPASKLDAALRTRLLEICGEDSVDSSAATRIRHAAGRSYIDLLRLRSGKLECAPDAVVTPPDADAVAAVLAACSEARCAVVPFGGGTSVVGGVAPLRGDCASVISLDLSKLTAVTDLNTTAQTVCLGAGLRGPDVEQALGEHGFTLGHYPQSFEYATVGGFAAARSAGQASSGYGRFDELILGLRLATPRGTLTVHPQPASAAGPSLLELVLGSEGALGVITDVVVAIRRKVRVTWYEGWSFKTFDEGVEALRGLAQTRVSPDVARLSDAEETRIALAMSPPSSMALRYLRMRGHDGGCVLIAGWDSDARALGARHSVARRVLRHHGGISLGRKAGDAWRRNRFHAPYLRDPLLDRGVLVETLETATTWDHLLALRDAVRAALITALRDGERDPLVGCHVSHIYPSGASLYFTVMARQSEDPVQQWLDAKRAATDAVTTTHGTITHHHGVGADHAAWMEAEHGPLGVEALRAVKAQLDPQGIMNPGKLLPA